MTDRDAFAAAALTGLLAQGDDGSFSEESYVRGAYRWADTMLRERERTNHDAAPAARASVESVAPQPTTGDRAGNPPSHSGTGDTPKPIKGDVSDRSKPITGPDPDSRVWETHTPATHATHGEGSVQRECTEPVAWAVMMGDGSVYEAFAAHQRDEAVELARQCRFGADGPLPLAPLYRHPPCQDLSRKNLTLTDAEREDLQMWLAECLRQCSTATEGANEELAERWQGRAKRAAAMIERLGGVE